MATRLSVAATLEILAHSFFSRDDVDTLFYLAQLRSATHPLAVAPAHSSPAIAVNLLMPVSDNIYTSGTVVDVQGNWECGTHGAGGNIVVQSIHEREADIPATIDAILSMTGRIYKRQLFPEDALFLSVDHDDAEPSLFIILWSSVPLTWRPRLREGVIVDMDCRINGARYRSDGTGFLPVVLPDWNVLQPVPSPHFQDFTEDAEESHDDAESDVEVSAAVAESDAETDSSLEIPLHSTSQGAVPSTASNDSQETALLLDLLEATDDESQTSDLSLEDSASDFAPESVRSSNAESVSDVQTAPSIPSSASSLGHHDGGIPDTMSLQDDEDVHDDELHISQSSVRAEDSDEGQDLVVGRRGRGSISRGSNDGTNSSVSTEASQSDEDHLATPGTATNPSSPEVSILLGPLSSPVQPQRKRKFTDTLEGEAEDYGEMGSSRNARKRKFE